MSLKPIVEIIKENMEFLITQLDGIEDPDQKETVLKICKLSFVSMAERIIKETE